MEINEEITQTTYFHLMNFCPKRFNLTDKKHSTKFCIHCGFFTWCILTRVVTVKRLLQSLDVIHHQIDNERWTLHNAKRLFSAMLWSPGQTKMTRITNGKLLLRRIKWFSRADTVTLQHVGQSTVLHRIRVFPASQVVFEWNYWLLLIPFLLLII